MWIAYAAWVLLAISVLRKLLFRKETVVTYSLTDKINFKAPLSYAAKRNLKKFLSVSEEERTLAWIKAYEAYLFTATTTDGSFRQYAIHRANRFWPNYLGGSYQ